MKGTNALKLTIDSTEPLKDTLRVVGAIYNVTLEVSGDAGDATPPADEIRKTSSTAATSSRAKARSAGKRPTSKRARTSSAKARPASNSAVRAWARENGYPVADRGRIPAEVVTAYRQSQSKT